MKNFVFIRTINTGPDIYVNILDNYPFYHR